LPTGAAQGLPITVQHEAAPAPKLPALSDLPVAGAAPVSGHLNIPQVAGVTDKADSLSSLRPAAAEVRLTEKPGTLFALAIGGLLAAASAIMAYSRKIRISSRGQRGHQ
jgi:hypothetical protein